MDSTKRFTNRVDDYERYRPGYPKETFDKIRQALDWNKDLIIADIGSGTGMLTELFVTAGNKIYGIEPNKAMRQVAENKFAGRSNFISIEAIAEATSLESCSIDLVTAASALHWFDASRTKPEFARILRPQGRLAVFANRRKDSDAPLDKDLEAILKEFGGSDHHRFHSPEGRKKLLRMYFGNNETRISSYSHQRDYDQDGLIGYFLSHSTLPNRMHPGYPKLEVAIDKLFRKFQKSGLLTIQFEAVVTCGQLPGTDLYGTDL